MKFTWLHWLVVGLLAVIIAMILFWPKPQPSTVIIQARDSIQRITEANRILAMNARTLETRLVETQVKSKSDSARFYREITVKNQQLARKRVQIDTLILENPNLASYMETADSVFSMMHSRIDSLEAEKKFLQGVYNDLVYMKAKQISNLEMVVFQKDLIIRDQEKTIKKRSRGAKLWKAAAVTLGVAGVVVGSQL